MKVSDIEEVSVGPSWSVVIWSDFITIQEWCNCATCKLALTLLTAATLSNKILEINKCFFYNNTIWISKWCKKYRVSSKKLLIEFWRLCCIPSKKSLIPDFKWPPYGFFCSSKQGQTLPSDVHGNIWPHSMQFWLRLMGPWFYLQLFFRQSVPYWTLRSNVKRNIKVPPISDYLSLIT